MDFSTLETLFSKTRLSRYLVASGGNTHKAALLYKYNIQASQCLHPISSILEVALRNAIDKELSKHFNDNSWLITQRNNFANHPNMVYKDRKNIVHPDLFFSDKLVKAEQKLLHRNVSITPGKLMAELTFGFWVKFYDSSAIKILKGVPLQALINKPSIKLASVHSHLNQIVALRNRISHSEPICFNKQGNLCIQTLANYEKNILDSIEWVSKDLRIWAEGINGFKGIINEISKL